MPAPFMPTPVGPQETALQQAARIFMSAKQLGLRSESERATAHFLAQFHNAVTARGLANVDPRGDVTTMRLASFGLGDETFLVPMYDPALGRVVPAREAIQNAMPHIRSGRLRGFKSHEDAEAFRRLVYRNILGSSNFAELLHPTDAAFDRITTSLTNRGQF